MGRHKGSGEGSIFKSGNSWRGQITLDGERRSVSGKTKKEVADKLAALRVTYNSGEYAKRNDITVEEWIDYWLTNKVEPRLAEQSFIKLEALLKYHICSYLGDERVQELDQKRLEEMYATVFFTKGNSKNYKQKDYSHSTVNALSIQFKKCLQYAVDCGVLAKNPHNGVELHKLRPPKKVNSYTRADQEKIICNCKRGIMRLRIFYFLISTGMRFGEAAALTWNDIDLNTGEIKINKTAVAIHGSMVIQDRTKTAAGTRTIFVGQNITEWLRWHKSTLDEEVNYQNLVFPNQRYNIMNQANAVRAWTELQEKLEIKHQGMHALRHTWATRALEEGIDIKVVSQMLGHKNIITTMNLYQDVLDAEKQKAACTLNALF